MQIAKAPTPSHHLPLLRLALVVSQAQFFGAKQYSFFKIPSTANRGIPSEWPSTPSSNDVEASSMVDQNNGVEK